MEKPKISFDTERLYVRSVEETDKDDYMNLRVETSELSQAYQSVPGFRDYEWEGELNSQKDIYMAVFMKISIRWLQAIHFRAMKETVLNSDLMLRSNTGNRESQRSWFRGCSVRPKKYSPESRL